MKKNPVDTVILCGGLGTRLRAVIGESPKPMAEFDHEPFLNVLLKDLKAQGFKRAILCAGYKGEVIEDYYRQHDLGVEVIVSLEPKPLGTGGAIANARRFIKSQPFLVLNGDSYCRVDYSQFMDFHLQKKALASMAVVQVKDQKDYGLVVLNQDKKIVAFKEKSDLTAKDKGVFGINAGMYFFNQEIFDLSPSTEKFSLEYDIFPKLVNKDFFGFEVKEGFIDIGTPERYQTAQTILKKK